MTKNLFTRAPRWRVAQLVRAHRHLFAIAALIGCMFLVLPSRPQSVPAQDNAKRLAVYGPQTGYFVPVLQRDGKDYVALADVLSPIGAVTAKAEAGKWKLRCACPVLNPAESAGKKQKEVEAQFTFGKTDAKVRGRDMDLDSRFLLENGRGLLPLKSLPAVLTHLFDTQVEFHAPARRLFLGAPAVHYTAQLQTTPSRLVLSFNAPVNPSIATEPGRLRMKFTREPLISATSPVQNFDDRAIVGIAFNENNGAAELAVSGTAPLTASFSNGGRTITITPLSQPATALPLVPAQPTNQTASVPKPRVLVLLDPGHGGSDTGAALGDMAEKDFDLVLARRLRALLEDRGIHSALLRDGDTALSFDQRALASNAMHPAVYLAVHATMSSTGVRVYTSDLPPSGSRSATLLPWDAAQAAYAQASTAIASAISGELGRHQVVARRRSAPIRPLNNVAAAAIAVEVGPPENDSTGLASLAYQQSVCDAIASAMASMRARVEGVR